MQFTYMSYTTSTLTSKCGKSYDVIVSSMVT